MKDSELQLLRAQLEEFLHGGFAPTGILLREFHPEKAGIVLEGLHFSAWILLGHMRLRQARLLQFMREPEKHPEVWGEAPWPENHQPTPEEWLQAIADFEQELQQVIRLVRAPEADLFHLHSNGKNLAWAAQAVFHHNAYHLGQLKTIGRQLGVW